MTEFRIPKESSLALMKRFRKLVEEEPLCNYHVTICTNVKQNHFTDNNARKAFDDAIIECDKHPGLAVISVDVNAQRGNAPSVRFDYQQEKLVDKLRINSAEHDANLRVLSCLESHFEFRSLASVAEDLISEELRFQLHRVQDAQSLLNDNAGRISEVLTEHAAKVVDRDREAREALAKTLEKERAALEDEYQRRREVLTKAEEAVSSKEHELKLLEHRGVRRTMLNELLEDLNKSFTPSRYAASQRTVVHLGVVSVLGFCFALLYQLINFAQVGMLAPLRVQMASNEPLHTAAVADDVSTLETADAVNQTSADDAKGDQGLLAAESVLRSSGTLNWVFYVPVASMVIVIISTILMYLRWIRAIYSDAADFDFESAKFKRDILRANWLAELMLEAKNPTREGAEPLDLPDALLAQFSNRLFDSIKASAIEHPLEQLQRYAKQFKKLTVGPVTMESTGEKTSARSEPT